MASSANFVLKAYKTEANARADSNPLAIDSATSSSGSTIDNPSQATQYGFWAFQRYWYRIEANEPVSEFHIDWDDGASNKKADADYQWWTTTEPTTSAVLTHTYTATGNFIM